MTVGTKGYDELAARRAAEIDEVLDSIAVFADPPPARLNVMFEQLLLGYAALRSRDGEQVKVLLGQATYDRAQKTGLLAWCAIHYPSLTFEPPNQVQSVRGCHTNLVAIDEIAQMP